MKEILKVTLFYIVGLAGLFGLHLLVVDALSWKCEQKWVDSGMEYQYSWGGGCRIKTTDGVWIPAENYREI